MHFVKTYLIGMYKIKPLQISAIHQSYIHQKMVKMPREVALMIFVFWIFAPTVDQCFDIALIAKLFKGPEADLQVSGGMVML